MSKSPRAERQLRLAPARIRAFVRALNDQYAARVVPVEAKRVAA